MDINTLVQFKDFLADRPAWAFLTLSMFVNIYFFMKIEKLHSLRFSDMQQWLPVAGQLGALLSAAALKARRRPHSTPSADEENP